MRRAVIGLALWGGLAAPSAAAGVGGPSRPAPRWQSWRDDVFVQAVRQRKLVLLDLEAVWCHWCHVMDGTTYADPRVVQLLDAHFIVVKVDQDARPDLSLRYEDYGWPATIVFDEKGSEIDKLSGYLEPDEFLAKLKIYVRNRRPVAPGAGGGDGAADPGAGSVDARRAAWQKLLVDRYDSVGGGWGLRHKFLLWWPTEYALRQAARGDVAYRDKAHDVLRLSRKLIDPVWGGVYQYSVGDWDHPHYEKIMQMQAEDLRIYAQAYAQFGDDAYRVDAENIVRFLTGFLRSDAGAFYTSMDADLTPGQHSEGYFALDDRGRRAQGLPRVDRHVYARENGWAIEALVAYAGATGDWTALLQAQRAAAYVDAHHAAGGGYRHADQPTEPGQPAAYLGDSLAMGRALLALYSATADRAYLTRARAAARYIGLTFARGTQGGFVSSLPIPGGLSPALSPEENIQLARFARLLSFYAPPEEDGVLMAMAGSAFAALRGDPHRSTVQAAGLLLAEEEMRGAPLHVTVVGSKTDARSWVLLRAAQRIATGYKRIELWDPGEGPLPHADVAYPQLAQPAAFICSDRKCSAPVTSPADLVSRAQRLFPPSPTR